MYTKMEEILHVVPTRRLICIKLIHNFMVYMKTESMPFREINYVTTSLFLE